MSEPIQIAHRMARDSGERLKEFILSYSEADGCIIISTPLVFALLKPVNTWWPEGAITSPVNSDPHGNAYYAQFAAGNMALILPHLEPKEFICYHRRENMLFRIS